MAGIVLSSVPFEPGVPRGIVLDGHVQNPAEVAVVEIYWRWEDDDEMEPQFLGETKTGTTFSVPFEMRGREIRLFAVGRSSKNVRSSDSLKTAHQTVYAPDKVSSTHETTKTKIASEDLFAGAMLNVWDDGGTAKARLADATDATKPADLFVLQDVDLGETFLPSGTGFNTAMSGLTNGARLYLSETPGEVTETPPTGTGKIVQQVGVACSDSIMSFEPQPPVELA